MVINITFLRHHISVILAFFSWHIPQQSSII